MSSLCTWQPWKDLTYPWDLRPQSMMTNANVEQVGATVDGRTLTLKYKDGEKKIFVPANTPIVIYEVGDRTDLKPGAQSSLSPSSSPTERSRVVRGVLAVTAQRQRSERAGCHQPQNCQGAGPRLATWPLNAANGVIEYRRQCPLLAHSGHRDMLNQCPLLGVKRTLRGRASMSANDPKRKSERYNLLAMHKGSLRFCRSLRGLD